MTAAGTGAAQPAGDAAPPSRGLGTDVLWVGGGIGVYGLASFAFLALCAQALGEGPAYTAVALLWTLLNALGIGLYLPVEQETSRRVAARRSLGQGTASAVRSPALYAGWSLLVVAVALIVGDRLLTRLLFAYLARGVLGGTGRFPRYGVQLAVDGLLRVGGVALLGLAEVRSPLAYGAVLALAPLVSTGLALLRSGPLLDRSSGGPPVAGSMRSLVLASVTSQALANAGPVAAQLLERPDEAATTAQLVNALTVARIPLFLFAAVQAVFLPRLATYVARGERGRFVGALRTALLLTGGIGALGVVVTALVGPQAVRLLFGPGFDVARPVIAVLALSAVLFMVVQVLVQALLALGHDGSATWAWTAGLAALVVALAVPAELAARVSWALTVGSAGALVVAIVLLRLVLLRWEAPSPPIPSVPEESR
jgi:O-antigen/teichoic acid export membrane protein